MIFSEALPLVSSTVYSIVCLLECVNYLPDNGHHLSMLSSEDFTFNTNIIKQLVPDIDAAVSDDDDKENILQSIT